MIHNLPFTSRSVETFPKSKLISHSGEGPTDLQLLKPLPDLCHRAFDVIDLLKELRHVLASLRDTRRSRLQVPVFAMISGRICSCILHIHEKLLHDEQLHEEYSTFEGYKLT